MNDIPPIRPEVVAAKLAALRNYDQPEILEQITKEPRLVELLWFIQWHSFQPGGLRKFVENFLSTSADLVGTPSMTRFGLPVEKYSSEQCLTVWREFPRSVQQALFPSDYSYVLGLVDSSSLPSGHEPEETIRKKLHELNYPEFKRRCLLHAQKSLPAYLASLCNEVSAGFSVNPTLWGSEAERYSPFDWHDNGVTWYFPNVIPALLSVMELQAKTISAKLAMTAVTVKVFDALDFCWEENALVHIEGDSRFGKTESVLAWANMHPGRARLVSLSSSNSDSDLYKNVAESLGMEVNLSRTKLKDRVEYVLQNGRLGIIFDEASFLLPQRYDAHTPPSRLNWVRTQIVDKGLPLALCVTPQNYAHAMAKFVKRTGYNMQQFIGRTMRKVILPDELDECDLIAVAKIHFPEFDEDYLALIAAKATQSESYLMTMESVSKLSRFIAKRDGHKQVEMEDLELAFSEILPARNPAPAVPAQPLQRPKMRIARHAQTPGKAQLMRQELRPLESRGDETISSTDRNRLVPSEEALVSV